MQILKNTVNVFFLSYDFLNTFFFLAYFTVRIHYIIHTTYDNVCVHQLFMVSLRLPIKSRLLKLKTGESKFIC